MLDFVTKLAYKEISEFIASNGFCVHELKYSRGTFVQRINGFFRTGSYYFDFTFNDISFSLTSIRYESSILKRFEHNEADISSEDWQLFLAKRFGEEYIARYLKDINKELVPDKFLSMITINDIATLLYEQIASVSCIKEVESLDSTKRRFKFYTGNATYEIKFSAFYDNSSIKDYISEERFLRFMYEKFGAEFAEYYFEVIDSIEKMIFGDLDEIKKISDKISIYKENPSSLRAKRYLAEKIFG